MLYIIIALFALAAVLGLVVLVNWLGKKDAPKGVVYAHGAFAAAALVTLLYFAMQNPDNYPMVSVVLFVAGALGGFYLFYKDQAKKEKPLAVALLHAGLGVVAFVMLLLFAFA
jgi:NAD/NADP transhydrogenase beta subunit